MEGRAQVKAPTFPLRFQVPVNSVQCFGEEYSVRLLPHQHGRIDLLTEKSPLFQRHSNCVVNWVKYRDGLLIAEIPLGMDLSMKAGSAGTPIPGTYRSQPACSCPGNC